jgi:glutaredoxin
MKKIILLSALFSLTCLNFASASTNEWCYNFKNDIVFGDKGADVDALKMALKIEGLYRTDWESDSYDTYITAAVMGFQNKYKAEILKPIGLTNPTGSVSTMTIKKLNSLFKCSFNNTEVEPIIEGSIQAKNDILTNNVQKEKAIQAALDYIKKYLAPGMTVNLNKTDEDIKSFYRMEVKANDSIIPTYISTDGKIIVYQETDITKEPQVATQQVTPTEVQKAEKPKVELFVMSHCPYGAQIEKGIIPVVETLKDKIDFQLKFCDYSMHGEEELKEELNQYCIEKEQNSKLIPYLKCFLKEGKSSECIVSNSIDTTKLNTCVNATEKEFKILENSKNTVNGQFPSVGLNKEDNTKYGVQGSPTLVINGTQVQSNRDSDSLLKLICSSFNNVPDSCNVTLSSDAPIAGFGDGTTQQVNNSSCGQ